MRSLSKIIKSLSVFLFIWLAILVQLSQNTFAAINSQREDVLRNSAEHDGDSKCVANTTVSENDGNSSSNGPSGYESGLTGDFILEQFAIHSLKALAATKGVQESDALTEQHVIAIVAFSVGEGGDIMNENIFNPLNHGILKNDNGIPIPGKDPASGHVRYETFDDGVDANARVLNGTYQQRVSRALTDPNTTAAQVMEAWTYYTEYPGDRAWAGASEPGTKGSAADNYYQGRLDLISSVISNWEERAGLIIGTPAFEQKTGATKPSLLTYHPEGSTTTGAEDNVTGNSDVTTGADGTGDSSSTAIAKCSSFEVSGLKAKKPEIDESKKDTFEGSGLIDNPTGVVLHWTATDANRTVDQFISDIKSNKACGDAGCSVQFYIDGSGKIYQLVDPINTKTAHAEGANDCCIGIEIGGTGATDLLNNEAQKQSVVNLTAYLVDLFNMQIDPDVPALKGILSHHITPKGIENGKQDVGDEYHQQIISAVKSSSEESGANCPSGVSPDAPYKKWCGELQKLLDSSDKSKIDFAKQVAINRGTLLPESKVADSSGIRIATSVKPDLELMIKDAQAAGMNLEAVSGFRTFEDQALQRIEFCSAGQKDITVDLIFVDSNADCSTSVLIPGTSKHNGGKAVDFGFNGVTDDPQFAFTPEHTWLAGNASKYGFATIAGEPWHWEQK